MVEKPIATDVACPRAGCDGKLVQRRGKRKFFYGCSNFPDCDFITSSLERLAEQGETAAPAGARPAKKAGTAKKTQTRKTSPRKTATGKSAAKKTATGKKAKTAREAAAAAGRAASDDESAAR